MPSNSHLQSGARAEDFAQAWLSRRGLKTVARNFRCRRGELDLVMLDGEQLVIVEVRYRANDHFGNAAETVNRRKQDRIIAATRQFLSENRKHTGRAVRFDVLALHGNAQPLWLRDAFQTT